MTDDSGLSEALVFEVPDFDSATGLAVCLADRWACSVHDDLGLAVVSVFLSPDGDGDLAPLLRRVENWVAARSLGAIRYWLDCRAYILDAGFVEAHFTLVR